MDGESIGRSGIKHINRDIGLAPTGPGMQRATAYSIHFIGSRPGTG
jgi:hypothetical protein